MRNKPLANLLTESLQKAKLIANADLDRDLFKALDWPETIQQYVAYVTEFARWMPRQSIDKTWTDPGTDEQQEVYDRLCHFYWLIDQETGLDKKIIENNEWFSQWLIGYANAWGDFLDTIESFNREILESFINDSPKILVLEGLEA